ncbi:hypothetical protein E2C01_042104 [Portunus trituberculatus]|uniref:Uncharacterized protein n=1 Tax=Portunus trituberculatus TaxID=210409 RepID=A0A5B7FS56_PORTR|nr:hypothetical protein [Portunus trituberculatus]
MTARTEPVFSTPYRGKKVVTASHRALHNRHKDPHNLHGSSKRRAVMSKTLPGHFLLRHRCPQPLAGEGKW